MQPFMQYKIESDSQVAISHGATGCLKSTIQALINPGDEVVIIDPSFGICIIISSWKISTGPWWSFVVGSAGVSIWGPKRWTPRTRWGNEVPLSSISVMTMIGNWIGRSWVRPSTTAPRPSSSTHPKIRQASIAVVDFRIFTREEINELAKVLDKHPNVWVVSDEAYSHICFPPHSTFQHPRALDHPKLLNRTVSIFSIGKIFSCSGLRIGACVGN